MKVATSAPSTVAAAKQACTSAMLDSRQEDSTVSSRWFRPGNSRTGETVHGHMARFAACSTPVDVPVIYREQQHADPAPSRLGRSVRHQREDLHPIATRPFLQPKPERELRSRRASWHSRHSPQRHTPDRASSAAAAAAARNRIVVQDRGRREGV